MTNNSEIRLRLKASSTAGVRDVIEMQGKRTRSTQREGNREGDRAGGFRQQCGCDC